MATQLLTFTEMAAELGVTPQTVQVWGRRRKFRVLRLNKRTYRVEREEIDRFKRQRTSQAIV